MNCHRTTFSREIKKGITALKDSLWKDKEVYVPEIAQSVYDANASAEGPKLKIGRDYDLADFIEEKIKEKYSPEVKALWIKESDKFNTSIHWKTIYNYIDEGVLTIDRDDLVYGEYRKKKQRPKQEVGHWEMDFEGKNRAIFACIKRKSKS